MKLNGFTRKLIIMVVEVFYLCGINWGSSVIVRRLEMGM